MIFSIQGLRVAITTQFAIRLEIFASCFILPLACFLGHTPAERAILVGSWILVFIIELLNSAIETTIDRIGPEFHTLSGYAKDLGSAAVLIALINALILWIIILVG